MVGDISWLQRVLAKPGKNFEKLQQILPKFYADIVVQSERSSSVEALPVA